MSNRLVDYPSAGTPVAVTSDGFARASSSWADATAFGGADASKSLTAAFDGLKETAWWPAPGDAEAWLEFEAGETVTVTATADTTVILDNGSTRRAVSLVGGQPRTVRNDAYRWLRLTEPVGIVELSGAPRIVEVQGTADTYFFQRLFPDTDVLQRRFTTAVDAEWHLSAPATIDGTRHATTVFLKAGTHDLLTRAETLMVTRAEPALPGWTPLGSEVAPAPHERIILTTRAYNEGLRATLGGTPLEPMLILSLIHI